MKIIEDKVTGKLRYLTVEFDRAELVTGGMGVISQDAVKRYFIEKRPDLKVKVCGGLKLDSQRDIVTMRVGVVNQLGVENPLGVDPIVASDTSGYGKQKFLNLRYDELLLENKKLKEEIQQLRISEEALLGEVWILKLKASGREELSKRCDALVIAHDKLLEEHKALTAIVANATGEVGPETDLANVKEIIAEDDFVDVFECEPELADGKPDCNPDDCKNCESGACNIDKVEGPNIEGNVTAEGGTNIT